MYLPSFASRKIFLTDFVKLRPFEKKKCDDITYECDYDVADCQGIGIWKIPDWTGQVSGEFHMMG